MVDIRVSTPYQFLCTVKQPLKVIRSIGDLKWLKSQPMYHVQDGVNVDLLLCFRVGVVVSEVAAAVVEFGEPKIDT